MAKLSPAGIRAKIPLPRNRSKVLAWGVFILGSVMLFDIYSKNTEGTWPITSVFPW